MHLIIDGYSTDAGKLEDEEFVYQLLERYPERIGMIKISPPKVAKYVGTKPQDWGISGFVLIAESHISIHTFPERRYINIDIFSCKDFDAEQAIAEMRQGFELNDVKTFILDRGLAYYQSKEPAKVQE